ncbi:MAG TPA: protein kinase [Verrucomicrobiae bacterium]|nr:protein kinase [Verrucomicrobiae bacterium]
MPEPSDTPAQVLIPGLIARPDFFQKYELIERIGGGGQGVVWKVWDFDFRRQVAMKRLGHKALESPSALHRFLAEAQIASQLQHPGILPIFDMGLDPDGRPFYTTQLLPGLTLGDIWAKVHDSKNSEWTIPRALELLLHVCDVMAHAHSRGVIHRDLKPANILVGSFGDVRVIDWGSAHVLKSAQKDFQVFPFPLKEELVQTERGESMWADPNSPLATGQTGQPITIPFMPPEILRGETKQAGPQTEVYSLGVMLYALLTGRMPYSQAGGSLPPSSQLRDLVLGGAPAPVRSVAPNVSRDLAAVCAKAMAQDIDKRYSSMMELADEIRAVLEVRPVQARRPGPFLKLQKLAQRNVPLVLMGSCLVAIASLGISIDYALKTERDSARQITSLRDAELAARGGRWRDALRLWGEAEAEGFKDPIFLGLQRAQAWTVLTEPRHAQMELDALMRRSDLGSQRGAALVRLGEHELFDARTFNQGVLHVRESLTNNLNEADNAFARGLLADSTPEALKFFNQAIQLDPYHHGAHRHSLGLEFLLGRHQEMSNHIAVFKVLYPDDPSPIFLTAAQLAMQGRLADARDQLKPLHNEVNSNTWEQINLACEVYANTATFYDLDSLLKDQSAGKTNLSRLQAEPFTAAFIPLSGGSPALMKLSGNLRMPRLPCLEQGVLEATDGLRDLLLPFLGNPVTAVKQIKSSWQHHPEALIPLLGGMLLQNRQPPRGVIDLALMRMQCQLYQMASDSPSMMPGLGRLARYLATRAELDLSARSVSDSPWAGTNCLANMQRVVASPETSAAECQAYCQFALELKNPDLARQLITIWEQRKPSDLSVLRSRAEVEISAGAYGPALKLIDQLLTKDPADAWALEHRQTALDGVNKLIDSTGAAFRTKP